MECNKSNLHLQVLHFEPCKKFKLHIIEARVFS
jgi:hypothetical protein